MKYSPNPRLNAALERASRKTLSNAGFSLIELLSVVVVMALLTALVIPATMSLIASSGFRSNVTAVDGILEDAYSAALAKNTYVWIGFSQLPINGGGVGVVTVFSPHEDPNDFPNNVTVLTKPVFLTNLNLATISAAQISNPSRVTTSVGQITAANIGAFSSQVGGSVQTLSFVMEITPSGQISLSSSTKYAWVEIGMAPLTGNGKNAAVLQMNAFTGRVASYRP